MHCQLIKINVQLKQLRTKMKKTTTLLLTLMLGIGVVFADGAEEKEASELRVRILPGASEQVYKLMYLSEEKGLVKVNFYDSEGKKIFTDKIYNKFGFLRPYSFEALPEGTYTIELIDPKGTVSKEIAHITSAVSSLDVELTPTAEQAYKLSVVGNSIDPIMVKIYDQRYDLVTEDYIETGKSFSKIYNLSKMPKGHYTFEVYSKGDVIAKTIF